MNQSNKVFELQLAFGDGLAGVGRTVFLFLRTLQWFLMGCAPLPRKNDNIPKTNSEPMRKDITSIDNFTRIEDSKLTKTRFEDIANNDINIKEERRVQIKVEKMDFLNKVASL